MTIDAPKTRSGKIFKAFIDSLDQLSPLLGKHPPAVLRKKTWRAVRKRVPDVTQAVVTRTLYKALDVIEWKKAYEKKWAKRRKRRAAS